MKAITVEPGVAGSARYEEVPEPDETKEVIRVTCPVCGASQDEFEKEN